jgi:hypothetical protein
MTRTAVLFATLLALAGCSGPGVLLAGASLATLIHTDKMPADHLAGYVTEKDCSVLHTVAKEPYCQNAEPDGHERLAAMSARLYCYRTLGGVSCYDRPDYSASSQTRLDYAYRPGGNSLPGQAPLAALPEAEVY